ncbi:Receptor-type tyrosine-protein phosphatase epsilon, partial [Anas platyrhynchos]
TEENNLHRDLLTSMLILLLVFIIFILLAGYFFRFRRHRKAVVNSGDKKMPNGILEEQEQQRVMLLSRSPSGPKKYFPIPVENLEEEIRIRSADEGKLFREEFNSLTPGYVQGTFEMANKEENREKNRYPNILPYDHSRVILSQIDGVPPSDYINASYIDGYKEKNKFIAAQGPKQETVNDFWRMIWEQKSAVIVMLTNLKERKEEKCYQYWPDQGCWTYGNIRVSVEDCIVLVDYTIRKFCVQSLHDGCKALRLVTQLHFTSWPDFGVPFTPIGMLKFLKKVKTLNPAHAGPVVVHCRGGESAVSAKVSFCRTEFDVGLQEADHRQRGRGHPWVRDERGARGVRPAGGWQRAHHGQGWPPGHVRRRKISVKCESRKQGSREAQREAGCCALCIPALVTLILTCHYTHVSLSLQGYRQKDYFIATQGPLPHTVEDFWRMVWEWKCHTIVMLTEVQEREQEKCFQYWPSEGSVTHGDINVEIKNDNLLDAISVRDFIVTYNQGNHEKQSRLVRQFHFHGWPEIGIPAEGKGMIDLIAAVQKQQQQTGNHPITVHCSAGAGRTGTFIALSNILERVKAEGLLDVFQAVKSLRLQRPHMVQTL